MVVALTRNERNSVVVLAACFSFLLFAFDVCQNGARELFACIRVCDEVDGFHIAFAEGSFDESPFARCVAEACGIRLHERTLTTDSTELLTRAIWHAEEPLADNSMLPFYLLAGFAKRDALSTEGAIKYFLLGSFSSAILLFGLAFTWGLVGSTRIEDVANHLAQIAAGGAVLSPGLAMGLAFMTTGVAFKIAAVPFHYWTPDAYQGSPTPVTGYLSVGPKVGAFALILRLFVEALGPMRTDWLQVVIILAVLTMTLGNLVALTQTNVKRMLAYSSIGHAGYVLLGIIAVSEIGLNGVLVYSVVYLFATLGIWAVVLMLAKHEYAGEQVDDFEGLHRRAPVWAFAMVVFLLSLGGIPPTAGFIGKYFLFAAAVESGFGWLAVLAVLMSAVSMFFYFRIVMAMYLRDGGEAEVVSTGALLATHAFLGTPADDATLEEMYTQVTSADIYTDRGLLSLLSADSLKDTAPLRAMIAKYVTAETLKRVAAASDEDRMLVVGTTNIDYAQTWVWNMTMIAKAATPAASRGRTAPTKPRS